MPSAWHLEVGTDRLATLTLDVPGRKLNVFDRGVLEELEATVDALAKRADIGCLVLVSGKAGGFIAGADVEEIARVADPAEAEAASRYGQKVFAAWEALPFPTLAAIAGTCVGGGTELALASTFRLLADDPALRIGLPEIRLGILPGWGGSTRLPHRIGLAAALDVILAGRTVRAEKAWRIGLVDALVPAAGFLGHVRDFALEHRDRGRKPTGGPDFKELLLERNPLGRKLIFERAERGILEQTGGHYPAPLRALEVVRRGIEEGMAAGFDAEARTVGELATGRVSKNLLHVFRLTEEARRSAPGAARDGPVRRPAILGAGTMGGGIAQLLVQGTDLPVLMKDIREGALASGMHHAGRLFARRVEKKRCSDTEARRRMALPRPTLAYDGFEDADLVIEAVVEDLEVKRRVFAEVAERVPEGAVLASNTSSLPIGEIAAGLAHPERVVGMHFFSPVDRTPLVEVIAADGTSPGAIAAVQGLARRLDKTPVLVRDAPGFLVNRLLTFSSVEALWLLEEGYRVDDIDRAMERWGMPLGPLALTDEVGVDIAVKVAHTLHDAFGERLPLPPWLDRLVDDGRLGRKCGRGIYRYDGRRRKGPDPETYRLLGLAPSHRDPDPRALADRLVLPMIDEAARCLEEGVVAGPSEIDLAMILGTGFPPFRGGPCRWAEGEGLGAIVGRLERLGSTVGPRFAPSAALRAAAEAGGFAATPRMGAGRRSRRG